jgi:hypothetical protein
MGLPRSHPRRAHRKLCSRGGCCLARPSQRILSPRSRSRHHLRPSATIDSSERVVPELKISEAFAVRSRGGGGLCSHVNLGSVIAMAVRRAGTARTAAECAGLVGAAGHVELDFVQATLRRNE